jgi:hypothetical protein
MPNKALLTRNCYFPLGPDPASECESGSGSSNKKRYCRKSTDYDHPSFPRKTYLLVHVSVIKFKFFIKFGYSRRDTLQCAKLSALQFLLRRIKLNKRILVIGAANALTSPIGAASAPRLRRVQNHASNISCGFCLLRQE